MFGPRSVVFAHGETSAVGTGDGETTMKDFYVEAGTVGIVLNVRHDSSGSGTGTWKIYEVPYTGGLEGWTETGVQLLASAALAKDANARLVVDPRVTAVANTHAQTCLGGKLIRITFTAGTADASHVWGSVTQVI